MEEKIKELFHNKKTNKEIIIGLADSGINISESTLKRRLKQFGLFRGKKGENIEEIVDILAEEIVGIGRNRGYRRLKNVLETKHNVIATQSTVRAVQRIIDPEGIALRTKQRVRRRVAYCAGPNYSWSYDGHDKMVKYGITIHGCVDVFSGKLLWFEAGVTNHCPEVIALHYLKAIKTVGFIPYGTRSDSGTETVKQVAIQYALHDEIDSNVPRKDQHRYVKSTRNKIEACWSRYLRDIGHAIMEEGFEAGIYNEDCQLEGYIFRFVWINYINREFADYMNVVNNSTRKKSKNAILPYDKPNKVYSNPSNYDSQECGFVPNFETIDDMIIHYKELTKVYEMPDDFLKSANYVYTKVGSPKVELMSAWTVFVVMKEEFISIYNAVENPQ